MDLSSMNPIWLTLLALQILLGDMDSSPAYQPSIHASNGSVARSAHPEALGVKIQSAGIWCMAAAHGDSAPKAQTTGAFAELKDQNGEAFERAEGAAFLIFVVGDRSVSKPTQDWADSLEAKLPRRCQVVRLLDLEGLTRAAAPLVRRGIRKQVGEKKIHVFLDWKSLVATRFEIPVDEAVVVCLDEQDRVLQIIKGQMGEENFNLVTETYSDRSVRLSEK